MDPEEGSQYSFKLHKDKGTIKDVGSDLLSTGWKCGTGSLFEAVTE